MAGLDVERLGLAFQSRPDLVEQIRSAADSPARVALFNRISSFVCDQLAAGDEPALKRRRVDAAGGPGTANGHASDTLPSRGAAAAAPPSPDGPLAAAAAETVLLEIRDLSVSVPQRKKLDLCFTRSYLYARAPGTAGPVPGIVYAWRDMEHIFCLPVPEKAQVQFNYVVLPRGAALASLSKAAAAAAATAAAEPLLFTVPAGAPKPGTVGGASAGLAAPVADAYGTLLAWALEGQLRAAGNGAAAARIVAPDARVFASAARQPYRPGEKAVHVRAFRGSKDGYLFFLPTGVFWGFKKPLLFLPLDRIVAVSYTNVLQRTFNMVVEMDLGGGGGDAVDEVEFGMLDQEDYGSIDENYVRRHGLQDRSMAEQRRAKRELAENARGEGKRRGGEGGEGGEDGEEEAEEEEGAGHADADGGGGDERLTELQRAEKQLQDEEDEDEEDYDPGSDGYSDGSGESGEEGEGDEDEGEGEGEEDEGEDE